MARPKDPNKLIFRSIGLTAEQWAYVELFSIAEVTAAAPLNPTTAIGELVDRLRKMCPAGPRAFGRDVTRARYKMPRWLQSYAQREGLTRNEAAAQLVAQRRPEGY